MIIDHGFNGTTLLVAFDKKNIEQDINDSVEKILKLKKEPFAKIFVQIPKEVFEIFYLKLKEKDIKIKDMDKTKPILMLAL